MLKKDCWVLFGAAVLATIVVVVRGNGSCVSAIEKRIVLGDSLTGLVNNNSTVRLLKGYYDCRPVRRNDIAVYKYAGNADPLIKIVKAVPGDRFGLEQVENGWHIRLNGKRLANSEGEPYRFANSQIGVLVLYEKDYQGVIPDGAYLLMGNLANGSLDSTRFGLVSQNDLIGKVLQR